MMAHLKIIKATYSFPEFVPACKKLVYSVCSFFEIKSSLDSREQIVPPIFDLADPKNFKSNFNLQDFVLACKKLVDPICSFFIYNQLQSPKTRLAMPIFNYAQPKQKNRSTFNFCAFVSTCKKTSCLIDLFRRNSSFKNPAIWLAESIFACISGARFFPNIGFVQENSKYINFH